MKTYLKRRFRNSVKGMVPSHIRDALNGVRPKPFPWDVAAVRFEELRSEMRRIGYPQYLYGLLSAARTTEAIDCSAFTAIEFGVAGGNGLVALETYATMVEELYDLSIEIVGFDMAVGLPTRTDPRDCPFAFRGGEFAMDEEALRSRLNRALLRLGEVEESVSFFKDEDFAPIGFVSIDLDLYTSTRDSLRLFSFGPERYIPRITMYFDDLNGYPYTTVTGEWAAITEFNTGSESRQIGQIHGLRHSLGGASWFSAWTEGMFILHVFDHSQYNAREETSMPNLNLR